MARIVRVAHDKSAAIVNTGTEYVSVDLSTFTTELSPTLGPLVASGSWSLDTASLSDEEESIAVELASAAVSTLGVTQQTTNEQRRVYRVPSVVKNECFRALEYLRGHGQAPEREYLSLAAQLSSSASVDIDCVRRVRNMLEALPAPTAELSQLSSTTSRYHLLGGDYAQRWTTRVLSKHQTIVSSAFQYDPACIYLGGGDTPDSTDVNRLYKVDENQDFSQWDNQQWMPVDKPDDPLLIELDPESAGTLSKWINDVWSSTPDAYMTLSELLPVEYNLYNAAQDELDLDFLDRVTSVAASAWGTESGTQQRAQSAQRQPRQSDGTFNPGTPNPQGDTVQIFARARLASGTPLVSDIIGLVNDYVDNPTSLSATVAAASAADAPETVPVDQAVPDMATARPLYVAIVDDADTSAVLDLVAIVNAKDGTDQGPTAWRRSDGGWVSAPDLLSELQGVTPPPVVELTSDDEVKSVLTQIDQHDSSKSPDQAPDDTTPVTASVPMWGTYGELLPILAGGVPGVADTPKDVGNAERLRRYWTHGEGGTVKVRWGEGGDWYRCVSHLSKYLGVRAKGYCTLRHKDATGFWPGQAPTERGVRAAGDNPFAGITFEQDLITMGRIAASAAVASNDMQVPQTAADVVYMMAPPPSDDDDQSDDSFDGDGDDDDDDTSTAPGAAFVIPLLIPEELSSGDERSFQGGSLDYAPLPLPLLWQWKTDDGHKGSVIVGRIDTLERLDGGGLGNAHGVFDVGPYGQEAQRLVGANMLRGISVDLDQFTADVETASDELADDTGTDSIKNDKISVSNARMIAATLLPKPAFQECFIMLDDNSPVLEGADDVIPDGYYEEDPSSADEPDMVMAAIAASAAPVKPPRDWFADPKLDKPTPLSVSDDGRVFGHIAAWATSHIGLPSPTKPPHSKSNYAYFQTGLLRTDDGSDVNVGQLTLAGGHASIQADAAAAVRHYDDTASAVADVSAGEDRHGIWVSGALRPGTTPEQVRVLRASAPSGDWRPINGRLELVAVCQVNVPGFPVARAFVASGTVMALVAAGAQFMAELRENPVVSLTDRVHALEQTELDKQRAVAFARLEPMVRARQEALTASATAARARVFALRGEDVEAPAETPESPVEGDSNF